MLLHLSDVSAEPLHAQISRQIRAKILSGDLNEGDALPSIRTMAKEQHVSVITVQRAYEDLQREELIHSRRGIGVFVASLTDKQKQEMALDRLREFLAPILLDGLAGGLTPQGVIEIVHEILRRREGKR